MSELVNHPPHYMQGNIECIEAIKAALGPEGFKAYCRGQIIKYIWRSEWKGTPMVDYGKAEWYAKRLTEDATFNARCNAPPAKANKPV